MSTRTLKEYGLEFINEIAKDREEAKHLLNAKIAGAKGTILDPRTHLTYNDIEKYSDYIRDQATQTVDSELNRLTIKTLGRLRQLILGEKFLLENTSGMSQSQQEVIRLEDELQKLQDQIYVVIREKNTELRRKEQETMDLRISLKEYDDKFNEGLVKEKSLTTQLIRITQSFELAKKRLEELGSHLAIKQALLEKLKEQDKIEQKDIEEALANVEEVYQSNDQYYQQIIDDAVKQASDIINQEHKIKIDDLESRFKQEIKHREDIENQYKTTIHLLEEELSVVEKEKKKVEHKLREFETQPQKGTLVLNYLQKVLSTHPLYSAIIILMNLGGSMPLPTLAKAVGAHPIKLRQMLEDVMNVGLIKISNDDPPIIEVIET